MAVQLARRRETEKERLKAQYFNPKLYLRNPHFDIKASREVETALDEFEKALRAEQDKYQNIKQRKNITRLQENTIRAFKFKCNDEYIVIEADKNMGVTVWKLDEYIKKVLEEHLGNQQVYQNIKHRIQEEIYDLGLAYERFLERHSSSFEESVLTYFNRAKDAYGDRVAIFRATAKVHKDPVKLRPVVAKCGTYIEAVSKYVDVELQKLASEVLWCIKDSDSFRDEVIRLQLPPNAKMVTFDAVSMYSNIDITHAMSVMKHWFDTFVPSPGKESLGPTNTLLAAINLVMRNNIMQFGDSYFKQLIGTAMGTSCAVWFANLYFGSHEKHSILPEFKARLKRILFYRRFIDDVFFIWLGQEDQDWEALKSLFNNFGILKWEFNQPASSVDFLDLTLNIKNGKIVTKTYQKPNNAYLYIPPHSAHPKGMINGIIYSLLRTYWRQNSKFSDFVKFSKLLFQRHLNQGWDQAVLKQVFITALNRLNKEVRPEAPLPPGIYDVEDPQDNNVAFESRLFFHTQYHPNDIPKKSIRGLYEELCKEVFQDQAGIEQFTICYSRAKSLGSVVAKAQIHQKEGHEVSKYIAGELPDND